MSALSTELRRELERTVIKARDVAEKGARQALEALTVHEGKAGSHVRDNATLRDLRNRLRAHGRQLGDERNAKSGAQSIGRLEHECAYEHWHRMLFARFLAENDLLVEPESGVSVTLEEVEELAREARVNPWELASRYAQGALPQIFRTDDPVLAVDLPPETRLELEGLLEALPRETFLADDSLGWVYQFWQTEEKKRVNDSGEKITGETLPAVTQLFTEHYMVLFLLHNTLGAWHAGKVLTADDLTGAESEDALRAKVALHTAAGDSPWTYLRFVREPSPSEGEGQGEGDGPWRPAAGTFDGWPREAKDLKVLDPCCGSGHFLVAAFKLLVRLRMHEEGLSVENAVYAVLRDNLFGLELDARCVQLAAFNVALAAWSLVGRRIELPELHIACCGIGPSATEEEWIQLAEESGIPFPPAGAEPIREGLRHLHSLFSKAPTLGSLIDPSELPSDMFIADYETLEPYLTAAFKAEDSSDEVRERAIAAAGMAKASEILIGPDEGYTLIATNVPFRQSDDLSISFETELGDAYSTSKANLATVFFSRLWSLLGRQAATAVVLIEGFLYKDYYAKLRTDVFATRALRLISRLGARAFHEISGEEVKVCLLVASPTKTKDSLTIQIDATSGLPTDKEEELGSGELLVAPQESLLVSSKNVVSLRPGGSGNLLEDVASYSNGIQTGDYPRFGRKIWELERVGNGWEYQLSTVDETMEFGGREHCLFWENGQGVLRDFVAAKVGENSTASWLRGLDCRDREGIAVSAMGTLKVTRYLGELFDDNTVVVLPDSDARLPSVWRFCSDHGFDALVREIDRSNKVRGAILRVPYNDVAGATHLSEPYSTDPSQWLFHGRPDEAAEGTELCVAVARLLGYQWPAEVDVEMELSERARTLATKCGELHGLADADGIVCIPSVRGEAPAIDRLRKMLATAFGDDWSADREAEILAAVDCEGVALDKWLREKFFEQHCKLFDNRPFVWHIWDGRKDGFHALVNYHKLAAPDGAGRKLLESLTYSYLGDWINRQQAAVKSGEAGADGRLAAATALKTELENILAGEPPYDLFVRWKPLHEQAIGWNPDINDGVRLNIRPFLMAKDVGRKGAGILRFKPNIKWTKDRGKEPESLRPREDFPWFWGWDEQTENFAGGEEFDGNRWNDLHYTNEFKQAARDRRTN